jgi:hypothetical protein
LHSPGSGKGYSEDGQFDGHGTRKSPQAKVEEIATLQSPTSSIEVKIESSIPQKEIMTLDSDAVIPTQKRKSSHKDIVVKDEYIKFEEGLTEIEEVKDNAGSKKQSPAKSGVTDESSIGVHIFLRPYESIKDRGVFPGSNENSQHEESYILKYKNRQEREKENIEHDLIPEEDVQPKSDKKKGKKETKTPPSQKKPRETLTFGKDDENFFS